MSLESSNNNVLLERTFEQLEYFKYDSDQDQTVDIPRQEIINRYKEAMIDPKIHGNIKVGCIINLFD